jgi:L-2-hydroxyglutarate oxidase LhgO
VTDSYEYAVIGAGVVGAAIARRLALADRRVVLIEAGADVGAGTSKANTAILHTGFDAKPDTLESELVRRGYELLADYSRRRSIALEPTGAMLIAWTPEQLRQFDDLLATATANGYEHCRFVDVPELRSTLPELHATALGAIAVPDESIIDPWTPPIAFATDAVAAGATLLRSSPVTGIDRHEQRWEISGPWGHVRAEWIVNAAGLRSDEIDRRLGHTDFTITPRRGELVVYDKNARPMVPRILLPVPTPTTKGVLVAPTVFGNVLVGPTADDIDDKAATGTTRKGLDALIESAKLIVPALSRAPVIATYAGLRAATEHRDFCVTIRAPEQSITVGGIRSTGLTASLAIAEHVCDQLDVRPRFDPPSRPLPPLGEQQIRPHRDPVAIARDPAYGALWCFCERVSVGEVRDAYASAIPPVDLDGLRRRTRAIAGRCNGFSCLGTAIEQTIEPPSTPCAARYDVAVVGGGPAGLALAESLARHRIEVVVLERDRELGGIPRLSPHRSFGMTDYRRMMRGPDYARRRIDAAAAAGADLRVRHAVLGWGAGGLEVTSPGGLLTVDASRYVLATGSRERTRAGHLVPGDRPAGVFTTGSLQRLVRAGEFTGRRALVVGAEHVSYSAALTLLHARCEVTMVTARSRPESFIGFASIMRARGVALRTNTRLATIRGRVRVEAVEFDDGTIHACDTVVFTGDWVTDDDLVATAPPGRPVHVVGNLRDPGRRADLCAREAIGLARELRRVLEHAGPTNP